MLGSSLLPLPRQASVSGPGAHLGHGSVLQSSSNPGDEWQFLLSPSLLQGGAIPAANMRSPLDWTLRALVGGHLSTELGAGHARFPGMQTQCSSQDALLLLDGIGFLSCSRTWVCPYIFLYSSRLPSYTRAGPLFVSWVISGIPLPCRHPQLRVILCHLP